MPLMHETWGGWPWIAPFWILFWVACSSAVFAVRLLAPRRLVRAAQDGIAGRRTEILAERFARGEIDAAEYRSRLDALRQ